MTREEQIIEAGKIAAEGKEFSVLVSMTDEEREEYSLFIGEKNGHSYFIDPISQMDWLNKKMIDYRGLIEKGLALEAPEGMYNN